jgi:hypothetical protein
VLRRIFGPKRGIKRRMEKLESEELHNMYCIPNIVRIIKSRKMRWVGHVAYMEQRGTAYKILVGKCEGKRPLRSYKCRSKDNVTMDLKEIVCEGVDWINLTQDKVHWPGCCEYGKETSGSIKGR